MLFSSSSSGTYSFVTKRISSEKSMTMNLHCVPTSTGAPPSPSAMSSAMKLFEGPSSPSPSFCISSTSLSLSTACIGIATSSPPRRFMIGMAKLGLLIPKGPILQGPQSPTRGSPSIDHFMLCFSISPGGGLEFPAPHRRSEARWLTGTAPRWPPSHLLPPSGWTPSLKSLCEVQCTSQIAPQSNGRAEVQYLLLGNRSLQSRVPVWPCGLQGMLVLLWPSNQWRLLSACVLPSPSKTVGWPQRLGCGSRGELFPQEKQVHQAGTPLLWPPNYPPQNQTLARSGPLWVLSDPSHHQSQVLHRLHKIRDVLGWDLDPLITHEISSKPRPDPRVRGTPGLGGLLSGVRLPENPVKGLDAEPKSKAEAEGKAKSKPGDEGRQRVWPAVAGTSESPGKIPSQANWSEQGAHPLHLQLENQETSRS